MNASHTLLTHANQLKMVNGCVVQQDIVHFIGG